MDHELITQWLGLPPAQWPPDHYALLGLSPGESDLARIEQQVHERMQRVRSYQLANPEAATEAMNRLAQALNCLTHPASKQEYDATLPGLKPGSGTFPRPPVVVKTAALPVRAAEPARTAPVRPPVSSPAANTVLDFDTARTPSPDQVTGPAPGVPTPPPVRVNGTRPTPPPATLRKAAPTPILESVPVDPIFETARSSPAARRGLGTKRALYRRIVQTRHLLRAWDLAGRYLGRPKRALTRPSEEKDLVEQLAAIDELLADFPPILGQPGQPGHHVVALARREAVVQAFGMYDPPQREVLAKDWMAGRTLLASHRQFLRQELRSLRKKTWWGRTIRMVRASLNEHPGYVLLGVGVVALLIALVNIAGQ